MTFQEQLEQDLKDVFFNKQMQEFVTTHEINGKHYDIIVDNETLSERKVKSDSIENVFLGDILFFIQQTELGYKPQIEDNMKFDGVLYQVSNVSENVGVLEITLSGNFGG